MRTIQLAVLAGLASAALATPALADDFVNVTPPLYREQARTTAPRRTTQLTTTPHPVAPAAPLGLTPRVVAEVASPVR